MGIGVFMNEKGQAAIEFIFIILIIVFYLATITRPLVMDARGITEDVSTIIRADSESKKLLNSITEVALMGEGSRKTIMLFVPNDARVHCLDGKVGFGATIKGEPFPEINVTNGTCDGESCCVNGSCDKNYLTPSSITINCQRSLVVGQTQVIVSNNGTVGQTTEVIVT